MLHYGTPCSIIIYILLMNVHKQVQPHPVLEQHRPLFYTSPLLYRFTVFMNHLLCFINKGFFLKDNITVINKRFSCCKPTLDPFSCENPVHSPPTQDIVCVKFLVLTLSPGGRTLPYAISSCAYCFARRIVDDPPTSSL